MALKIKTTNGLSALKKLGFLEVTLDNWTGLGVEVKLTATEFRFTRLGADGKTALVSTTPVNLDTLMSLNAGSLSPSAKMTLRSEVSKAVKAILPPTDATAITPEVKVIQTSQGTLSQLPKLTKKEQQPASPVEAFPKFDLAQMNTAQPVKLRDATMLYQPVFGTSSGSRYYLVAAREGLRIAARYKKPQLSVRVSGVDWLQYENNLEKAGFSDVGKSKEYTSVHLNVGSDSVLAAKTLGAILLGLGVEFDTPIPDLNVVEGK